jgi:hypothetical protein
MLRQPGVLFLAIILLMSMSIQCIADEGMWLLSRPPLQPLKETYAFEPPAGWLEHVQKSAVQFGGASGSLVSADGLVLTNHHVGSRAVAKLSTPDHDLLKTGFYAATRDAERKCADTELRVLWSITDVTAKVEAASTPAMSPAAANAARRL